MELSREIIREYVKCLNDKPTAYPYKQGLNDMNKIDLKDITEEDVATYIKCFLYDFGWMQRVLERSEYRGWEENLAKQIQANHERLDYFKTKNLEDVNLREFESDIKCCYESFQDAVGPIAAAKTLHFICPNFFPLWDRKIAKAAGRERNQGISGNGKVKGLSAKDYYMFVQQVQAFIHKRDIISELANQYGKGKVKIADECLWSATQRPLYLFF